MAVHGLFFTYFQSFQTIHFSKKLMLKSPFSIQCWDLNLRPLEHEPSPMTTRPGFPPKNSKTFIHSNWFQDAQSKVIRVERDVDSTDGDKKESSSKVSGRYWPIPNQISSLKACSDVLRKMHQPGLFFTNAKDAVSLKIIYLNAFYTGLNEPLAESSLSNKLAWN